MKLSVKIPTHDRGHFLQHSLYLLSKQTMDKNDFEVLLLDDGSTDGTFNIVKSYKDVLNIRYFYFDRRFLFDSDEEYLKNKDLYIFPGMLSNYGVKQAKSDIILYTDPEVMLLPDALEHHYLSHVPGHIIKVAKYTSNGIKTPIKYHNDFSITDKEGKTCNQIQKNMSTSVHGLCLKYWESEIHNFGKFEDIDWRNIEFVYNDFWNIIKDKYGDDYMLENYRNFQFYSFIGSQAGWSWDKKTYIHTRGCEEQHDRKYMGCWGAEDADLESRLKRNGSIRIDNMNIRGIHCYHPKPSGGSEAEYIKTNIKMSVDRSRLIANDNSDIWGDCDYVRELSL